MTKADESLKDQALRVLRNVLVDISEPLRAYPQETYDYWEASLRYSDMLFGQYEESSGKPEDADTLDLSSAVNELVEALSELRELEEDEDGCENVRTETIGPFEEALAEVQHALNALSEADK